MPLSIGTGWRNQSESGGGLDRNLHPYATPLNVAQLILYTSIYEWTSFWGARHYGSLSGDLK